MLYRMEEPLWLSDLKCRSLRACSPVGCHFVQTSRTGECQTPGYQKSLVLHVLLCTLMVAVLMYWVSLPTLALLRFLEQTSHFISPGEWLWSLLACGWAKGNVFYVSAKCYLIVISSVIPFNCYSKSLDPALQLVSLCHPHCQCWCRTLAWGMYPDAK